MTEPAVIVLVRFESRLSHAAAQAVMDARLPEFRALGGLQQKYYMQDASTGEYAGLYLWSSREAFEAFRDSALRATIAEAYEVEGEPRVEVYGLLKTLRDDA